MIESREQEALRIKEWRHNHPDRARQIRRTYNKCHAEQIKSWILKDREKKLQWFTEFKSTLNCSQCGENHPSCLDFHHNNPKEKSGIIAEHIRTWSNARLLKEISKCTILCANCHRKLHYQEKVLKKST